MKPVHWYLLGTGSWFVSWGIQSVLFSWLVTMVLHESPQKVGFAQMTMMLPSLIFLLVGGSLADRYGSRRIAMLAQSLAIVPPLLLGVAVVLHRVSYPLMLGYALVMGFAQAFLTPARDGMLSQVAQGRIQHTVLLASMVQFGVQLIGFQLAAAAARIGAEVVLLLQAIVLSLGVLGFSRLQKQTSASVQAPGALWASLFTSIKEGAQVVFQVPTMRAVLFMNVATGICFMGSFMVTLPLLVRADYGGTSVGLSAINTANSLGLMSTILILLVYGEVKRKGRALLIAHGIGVICLGALAMHMSFLFALALVYCWGATGGIAMSMARTLMQEQATEGVRGRVMALFAVSFMGAGPFGALMAGFLVDHLHVHATLLAVSISMGIFLVWLALSTTLWRSRNVAVPVPVGAE